MSKTYIDVPVIGHKTWLIVTGYKDSEGNFIEDENNSLIRELKRQYPYSEENDHVMQEEMKMSKVEVTMEKTMRVAMEFDATEEQIEMLENGENPFEDIMEKELKYGDIDYDFAAVNQETGLDIKTWD